MESRIRELEIAEAVNAERFAQINAKLNWLLYALGAMMLAAMTGNSFFAFLRALFKLPA